MRLAELRQLKRDWLQLANDNGYLDICRLVGQTLGDPFEIRSWPEYQGFRWESAGVVLVVLLGKKQFLPWQNDYNHTRSIQVFYHGRKVCQYQEEQAGGTFDNFFVPGAWLDVVLASQQKAREIEAFRSISLVKKERNRLLSQLLVAEEI
jgi:hypothetical protein